MFAIKKYIFAGVTADAAAAVLKSQCKIVARNPFFRSLAQQFSCCSAGWMPLTFQQNRTFFMLNQNNNKQKKKNKRRITINSEKSKVEK